MNQENIKGLGYMDVKEFNLRNKIGVYIEDFQEAWSKRVTKVIFVLICLIILVVIVVGILLTQAANKRLKDRNDSIDTNFKDFR